MSDLLYTALRILSRESGRQFHHVAADVEAGRLRIPPGIRWLAEAWVNRRCVEARTPKGKA